MTGKDFGNAEGCDMSTIKSDEDLVTASCPADAGLEYGEEWLFSKAQNQQKKAEQAKLNKIAHEISHTHSRHGATRDVMALFPSSLALGKGVRVIIEVAENHPRHKMQGAEATIVSKVDSPETSQCKSLRNIEAARWMSEKKDMKKKFETLKTASLKAQTNKLKAAKKATGKNEEAPEDTRDVTLKELEEDYTKKLNDAKEKHDEKDKELADRETACRTVDAFKVEIDELRGIEGLDHPVLEAVQLKINHDWYKVKDQSSVREEFTAAADDLEKMKTIAVRLPLEIECPDTHTEFELCKSVDLLFKPAAGYKAEKLHFCESAIVMEHSECTIRFKTPHHPSKHPDEKKKALLAAGAAAKAKAKAKAKMTARQVELKSAVLAFSAHNKLKKAGHEVELAADEEKKLTKKETSGMQKSLIEAAKQADAEIEMLIQAGPGHAQGLSEKNTPGGSSSTITAPAKIDLVQGVFGDADCAVKITSSSVLQKAIKDHNKRNRVDLQGGGGNQNSPNKASPDAKRSRSVSVAGSEAEELLGEPSQLKGR
eukprot:g18062.t1